jgi:hypothetical protein
LSLFFVTLTISKFSVLLNNGVLSFSSEKHFIAVTIKMKFGVHLLSNLTPEWNSQYIQYEYMKKLLDQAVAAAPILFDGDDNSTREQYFLRTDEAFFKVIITMYQSISTTYLPFFSIVKSR